MQNRRNRGLARQPRVKASDLGDFAMPDCQSAVDGERNEKMNATTLTGNETRPPARKLRKVGGGGAAQLCGALLCLLALVWWPFVIVGLLCLVAGGLARQTVCSECGNAVPSKHAKLCPTCRAAFVDFSAPARASFAERAGERVAKRVLGRH